MSGASADVAIIGMAARFAAAPDLTTFWDNVLDKVDAVCDAPDAWSHPYFDPAARDNDRIYTRRGGFLGKFVEFDPVAFGVMPKMVGAGDADHFLAIATAAAALDDAGYAEAPFDRERTGVVLGHGTYVNRGYDTLLQHGRIVDQTMDVLRAVAPHIDDATLATIRAAMKSSLPPFDAATVPGLVPNIIAGRIANRLDLKGPNYIVDAACASSLIAIELAVRELATGRCSMMLTGGVHASTAPQVYMMFCLLDALSRRSVRPFDKSADGTLLGEGVGMLVLKRRVDAERDGDRIYALIAGSGSASDGRALGLLTPREEGQVLALRRAYDASGIETSSVDLVEAHGTGTPVGDATEIATLGTVFGADARVSPVRALGSVKSMIGHCISAAGAAGVIKTALALHDTILPPTLCDEVNAALGCAQASFYVNTEARPWIRAESRGPRRAGVDAFGFGGVNAHVILEEYRQPDTAEAKLVHGRWTSELIVFSAEDEAGLRERLADVRARVAGNDLPSLASFAAAQAREPHRALRLALVCRDTAQLADAIDAASEALRDSASTPKLKRADVVLMRGNAIAPGRTAWLFPGEGSQYRNMLAELALCFPSVRAWFDLLDEVFVAFDVDVASRIVFPPPNGLSDEERARRNARLMSFDVGSAAVFTASMALHDLLRRLGCRADAMLGHSTGEGSALVAAGAIPHEDRSALIETMRRFYRTCRDLDRSGRIPKGQLLSVGAIDAAQLEHIVTSSGSAFVALDNCANQKVVFCDTARAPVLIERIHAAGGVCAAMPIDRAYHTPLFVQLEDDLRALYDELPITTPREALYSCATASRFPDEAAAVRELAARQWFSRVRFRETILALYEEGVRTFIEVGPGATLTSFVRDTLGKRRAVVLATNIPGRPALAQLQRVLAEVFVHGANVDFGELYRHRRIILDERRRRPRSTVPVPLTMPVVTLPPGLAPRVSPPPPPADTRADALVQAAPAPPANGRLAVLHAHFETMQQFLASQERVMAAVSGRAQSRRTAADGEISERTYPPWLGHVVERRAAQVRCERIFDIAYDRFLRDHTLGGALSRRDATLLPLPVLPFTAMMEIAAQAARCVSGDDRVVVAMHDAKAHRWLALDHGRLGVATVATVLPGADDDRTAVEVKIRSAGADDVLFEAIVLLAAAYRVPGPRATPDLASPMPSHYNAAMLYGDGDARETRYAPMFHGAYFRAVERIDAWDSEGIDATFRTRPLADSSGVHAARFVTDPVLLDAAGQLVGYWVAERHGVDLTFFPFAVRSYTQFADPLAPSSAVKCRARIRLARDEPGDAPRFEFLDADGRTFPATTANGAATVPAQYDACRLQPASAFIEADFEFIDDSGRVIARMEGWRDRYFSIPHAHYRLHLSPQRAFLSERLPSRETGEACRRARAASWAYLDDGWQIWKRALAHLVLSAEERRHWYSLPEKGPRRTEWLIGRVAAKDAVREWAQEQFALELAPVDVEVLPDARGTPTVRVAALRDVAQVPGVSISHDDGVAYAIAFDAKAACGIDAVSPRRVVASDLQPGFEPGEWDAMQATEQPEAACIRAWCAKEAAAKASGTGLGGVPADWNVSRMDAKGGYAMVMHGADVYDVRLFGDGARVVAIARGRANEGRCEVPRASFGAEGVRASS